MKKIAGILKYIYDKKSGMVGFKIGNNLTIKTYNRKMFKTAMKAALNKDDGYVKNFWSKNKR